MIFADTVLLQVPFETPLRANQTDWLGLSLLLVCVTLFMILQFRNPSAIGSVISRSIRENSSKLYFASPAIDSVDKILMYALFFFGTNSCLHYLFADTSPSSGFTFLIYLIPLAWVVFLILPFNLVFFISGVHKQGATILKHQLPVLFLAGISSVPLGVGLFLNLNYSYSIQIIFLATMTLFFVWMHIRVFRELIVEHVSFLYIFIYFCTLEILPLLTLWVWISRG